MAHSNRIERMPKDALTAILSRVAGQEDGAANIARAFAVSKTFRDFVEDGDVLRSVSFKDLFPCIVSFIYSEGPYERLSEVDGLVTRCSRAGNVNAKFILSKVVLVSASKLCNAYTGATFSNVVRGQSSASYSDELNRLDKATRLLDHLSAKNTDCTELFDLIRTFLSRAEIQDFLHMQLHLTDFVALYLAPGKKPGYQKFLDTLSKMCKISPRQFRQLPRDPTKKTTRLQELNKSCIMAHNKLELVGCDEQQLRPLLECLAQLQADVAFETKIEYLETIISILDLGRKFADAQGFSDVKLLTDYTFYHATFFWEEIVVFMDHEAELQSARESLLASFDALFCIQQGPR